MQRATLLDQAPTPDGQTLALYERGGQYTIRLGGLDLMSTRQHASEEVLAALACAQLGSQARILIGGLGFGFTLKAVLAAAAADARIIVAELIPAVLAWNQNPAYPLAAAALADPRVEVVLQDVADVIKSQPGGFDRIILDVDNGPAAFSAAANAELYQRSGLLHARAALRPGGCAAYWSATAEPAFAKQMERCGFTVAVHRARAHTTSGPWHALYLGRKA